MLTLGISFIDVTFRPQFGPLKILRPETDVPLPLSVTPLAGINYLDIRIISEK